MRICQVKIPLWEGLAVTGKGPARLCKPYTQDPPGFSRQRHPAGFPGFWRKVKQNSQKTSI
jgi:hypothetical protein